MSLTMRSLAFAILVFCTACKERHENGPIPQSDPIPPVGTIPTRNDSILVKIISGKMLPVDSCVTVSSGLESDPKFNGLLGSYICNNLYSNDTTKCDLDLVRRNSFRKMILLFYGDTDQFRQISFYDDKQKLVELRKNLLYGLKNCFLVDLHFIADTLLQVGNFDGLEVLWEKADLKMLPSLTGYLRRVDTGNFFVYADLAAFFHNNGNLQLRDTYLAKAKKISEFKEEYKSLGSLISKNKTFDIVTYKETVYGGM